MTQLTYSRDRADFLSEMVAYLSQELQEDEERLVQVSRDVEEDKRLLVASQDILRHYQESNGVTKGTNGPDKRYATLGPTEAIDLWADEHDDIVTVKELVAVMVASGGPYKTKRQANGSIDSTIRKSKRCQKLEPGIWRRTKRPKTRPEA